MIGLIGWRKGATRQRIERDFMPNPQMLDQFPDCMGCNWRARAGLSCFQVVQYLENSRTMPSLMKDGTANLTGDSDGEAHKGMGLGFGE